MSNSHRPPKTEECDPRRAFGFAASPVLPGESQEEFDSLRDDLYAHYQPQGPIEEDAVQTIANAIWRKHKLGMFQHAFEARMRFGSYFEYPGDPAGHAKIAREGSQYVRTSVEALMTAFVANAVEKELIETETDSAENMKGPAPLAESETGDTQQMASIAMSNALPEGLFRNAAQNAIAKIRASSTEQANRRTPRTMSAEDRAGIVRTAVQAELETDGKASVSGAPRSTSEQVEKLQAAAEMAFGHATLKEIDEEICKRGNERALAKLGELLTPQNYIAELRFNEVLDSTIERAHDRLMKYQASRATKSAANVKSLQSDWVARKRLRAPNHNIIGDA
jgi:hypothetical protein